MQLNEDDLMTFFAVFECCEEKYLVPKEKLTKCNEITCPECGEPGMFRGSNGGWYMVKARLF